MKKLIVSLLLVLGLGACSSNTQTTSGKSYLDKYMTPSSGVATDTYQSVGQSNDSIQDQIRQVAGVEPVLKFPARIGLARIDHGRLTVIPGVEAEAWGKSRDALGDGFGEFVPVNPMIAEMVSSSVNSKENERIYDVMNKIRLGAARQHLDAVLIYEVYSISGSHSNVLSIADLTLIGGYLLPSRAVQAEGFANAILIDVLQGYPYGSADATLEKEEIHTTTWGSSHHDEELNDQVKTRAVLKLTQEVETMFLHLRAELAEQRAK